HVQGQERGVPGRAGVPGDAPQRREVQVRARDAGGLLQDGGDGRPGAVGELGDRDRPAGVRAVPEPGDRYQVTRVGVGAEDDLPDGVTGTGVDAAVLVDRGGRDRGGVLG